MQKKLLAFILAALSFQLLLAQTDSSNINSRKNTFSANVIYQSSLNYFGRVDSLHSAGFLPTIGFESKTGLYAQGAAIFVNNALESFAYNGASVEAGYRFQESKHFSGNVFYSRFLYKDNSELVQSALKSQTGINLAYKNKIVNLNAGGDLKFSDKTDVGVTLGLDHLFIIPFKSIKAAIALNPSAYAYAGTQNFTNSYIKRKNVLGIPVSQQTVQEEIKQFDMLSYELSVPVVFVKGKFNATVTPSYVIPQNLMPTETGKNLFYVIVSAGVRL